MMTVTAVKDSLQEQLFDEGTLKITQPGGSQLAPFVEAKCGESPPTMELLLDPSAPPGLGWEIDYPSQKEYTSAPGAA